MLYAYSVDSLMENYRRYMSDLVVEVIRKTFPALKFWKFEPIMLNLDEEK